MYARNLSIVCAAASMLVCCNRHGPDRAPQSTQPATRPDPSHVIAPPDNRDRAIFQLVLKDLITWEEFHTYKSKNSMGTQIVVNSSTSEQEFMKSIDRQTKGEMDRRGHRIPEEVYQDLAERNRGPAKLDPLNLGDETIRVTDMRANPSLYSDREYALSNAFPSARGWAELRLPGYSKNGKMAIVRMSVGPTPHGACATYFLELTHDGWHIKWREMTYYA